MSNTYKNKKNMFKGFSKNSVIESHGPGVKLRGTLHQLIEKYIALGRESHREQDHVLAQSYFQHAEHYQRILNTSHSSESHRPEAPASEEKNISQNNNSSPKHSRQSPRFPAPAAEISEISDSEV